MATAPIYHHTRPANLQPAAIFYFFGPIINIEACSLLKGGIRQLLKKFTSLQMGKLKAVTEALHRLPAQASSVPQEPGSNELKAARRPLYPRAAGQCNRRPTHNSWMRI